MLNSVLSPGVGFGFPLDTKIIFVEMRLHGPS